MQPREAIETGVYGGLTLLFLGAGVYGLILVLGPAIPSISLSVEGLVLPAVFILGMVLVILLGAMAGSDGGD